VTTRSIRLVLLCVIHFTRAMKCACESRWQRSRNAKSFPATFSAV